MFARKINNTSKLKRTTSLSIDSLHSLLFVSNMRMSFKASPWLKSLEGKHVLITGGSSWIGLAIAREVLSQSFITLIAGSSFNLEKEVESLAQEYTNDHDTNVADKICIKVHDQHHQL